MRQTSWAFLVLIMSVFLGASVTAQQPPAAVVVAKVSEKEIARTNKIVGIVNFDTQSGVSSEVSGIIARQDIVEGQVVAKGHVLVRLNTDFLRRDIGILKKEIEQIDVKLDNTARNVKRLEALYKEEAISERTYEDLRDSYRELIKEKETELAKMGKLELELAKSDIRAPFSGLILERHKNEGEWVAPGAPICTIGSTEDVLVEVAVPEQLIRYVQPGQQLPLTIEALDVQLNGAVKTVVPVADMKSKTIRVQIAIPYTSAILQNMSVTVDVPVSTPQMLKMIKRHALVRNQGKTFVYTVKDGQAKILPVNIVAYEGEYIGVDNAYIVAGMPVVIDGNERLRPDQPVKVVEGEVQ